MSKGIPISPWWKEMILISVLFLVIHCSCWWNLLMGMPVGSQGTAFILKMLFSNYLNIIILEVLV